MPNNMLRCLYLSIQHIYIFWVDITIYYAYTLHSSVYERYFPFNIIFPDMPIALSYICQTCMRDLVAWTTGCWSLHKPTYALFFCFVSKNSVMFGLTLIGCLPKNYINLSLRCIQFSTELLLQRADNFYWWAQNFFSSMQIVYIDEHKSVVVVCPNLLKFLPIFIYLENVKKLKPYLPFKVTFW